MKNVYKTIDKESEGIFKDRGSKFLAFALPVKTEDEARNVLDDIRRTYHDARHHCYAWRIGTETIIERANDDGEPSNSAGKPILNQIAKHKLTNTMIIVVRYFGGTLLGVGGLINAYKSASMDALDKAKIVTRNIQKPCTLNFPYSEMSQVMALLKVLNIEIKKQRFELDCDLQLNVPLSKLDNLKKRIKILNNCSLTMIENDL